jgi:hypothetical protein
MASVAFAILAILCVSVSRRRSGLFAERLFIERQSRPVRLAGG